MTTIIREKRLISLNSNNATSYYNGTYLSDLSFDFLSILIPDKSIIYVEGGVQSAQIPVSFYNIDTTNNVFNYRISGVNFNIQIPEGNYNYITLTNAMTTQFAINGHIFTYSLNQSSNILTMTYTSAGSWQEIQPGSIYYILGFNSNTSYTITANTFTFPELFNLLGKKKLKIYSTNLAIDSSDSVGNSTNNLIETLSVNQPSFGMIIYNNIDSTYGHLKTSYLSTIDISIRDELNNFINFNNINWTMTIVLIIYKRLDTTMIPLELGSPPYDGGDYVQV